MKAGDTRRLLVVGAGPAGLMAACAAAARGARVTLVERRTRPGAKLLASGGGRCNFTNILPPGEFAARMGRGGRIARPALTAFDNHALRRFLETRGVQTECVDGFHVFPASNRARDVLRALLDACDEYGVQRMWRTKTTSLLIEDGAVVGARAAGRRLDADGVVIAAGGKSCPELGGSGDGYKLAEQAGHEIVPPLPALAAVHTREAWPKECAGIVLRQAALWVDRKPCRRRREVGDLLFTHQGVSGPAALNLSGLVSEVLQADGAAPLRLNLLPEISSETWREQFAQWRAREGRRLVRNLLARRLPKKLAAAACECTGVGQETRAAELSRAGQRALIQWLTGAALTASATEGFDQAMVTRGGVSLKQVSPKTLQSRLVRGLYFAGEVLDVDGPCGGFNLQWAFSSGYLAGVSFASAS